MGSTIIQQSRTVPYFKIIFDNTSMGSVLISNKDDLAQWLSITFKCVPKFELHHEVVTQHVR